MDHPDVGKTLIGQDPLQGVKLLDTFGPDFN